VRRQAPAIELPTDLPVLTPKAATLLMRLLLSYTESSMPGPRIGASDQDIQPDTDSSLGRWG
jgi:hypothetical protein